MLRCHENGWFDLASACCKLRKGRNRAAQDAQPWDQGRGAISINAATAAVSLFCPYFPQGSEGVKKLGEPVILSEAKDLRICIFNKIPGCFASLSMT